MKSIRTVCADAFCLYEKKWAASAAHFFFIFFFGKEKSHNHREPVFMTYKNKNAVQNARRLHSEKINFLKIIQR